MKILQKVYSDIAFHLSSILFEAGGIIGGQNDIITDFYFDDKDNSGHDFYIPDTCLLNKKIIEWDLKKLSFIGIVHSHSKNPKLSKEDIEYCKKVLMGNQNHTYMISAIFVRRKRELLLYEIRTYEDQAVIRSINYMIIE